MGSNHKVIQSLLKVVMLCSKQGLALCGHCDDSITWNDEDEGTISNEGNFVALVRFGVETDLGLAQHLAKPPRNAHYTSKTIQNEMVEVIGMSIRNDVLMEVNEAKFYLVIADEVTDIANKKELSLTLRYVFDGFICEVFVDFVEVERIAGETLAQTILA